MSEYTVEGYDGATTWVVEKDGREVQFFGNDLSGAKGLAELLNNETEAMRQRVQELEAWQDGSIEQNNRQRVKIAELEAENAKLRGIFHTFAINLRNAKHLLIHDDLGIAEMPINVKAMYEAYQELNPVPASENESEDVKLNSMQVAILQAHLHIDGSSLLCKHIELIDIVGVNKGHEDTFYEARRELIENDFLDNSLEPRHTKLTARGFRWLDKNIARKSEDA